MNIGLFLPRAKSGSGQLKKRRHLSPFLLFLAVYAGYNLLGLVDLPWIIGGMYDKSLGWRLFLTGLLGFLLGYVRLGRRPGHVAPCTIVARTSRQLSVLFLVVFVLCIAVTIITNHGIPLLTGESRFGNSALASNLAPLYGCWLLVRAISDIETGRKISFIQPVIYMVGVLILGYRAPVLTFVIVYYLYLAIFRLSGRKVILVSIVVLGILISFATVLAFFRVSQTYDVENFFKNVDFRFIGQHGYLLPFAPALSMFDYSQNTISSIGSALHEHMYGGLLLSNYETFLPGRHWGARNIVGDLVGARWIAGRPMSITPTLQGAFYVDFGYAGVFLAFFFIAFCMVRFHAYARRQGVLAKFSFSYLMTVVLLAVHAGYWDVSFIFFLFFLLIVKVFDHLKTWRRP